MRYLSIDPSLLNTAVLGWEDGEPYMATLIRPRRPEGRKLSAGERDTMRIGCLVRELTGVIDRERPDIVLVEQFVGGTRNAVSTKALALVAGAMSTLAAIRYGDTIWQTVRVPDVKQALTGSKTADKLQMIEAAAARFPFLQPHMAGKTKLAKWSTVAEHYADAAGVFVAFQQLDPFQQQKKKGGKHENIRRRVHPP